MHIPRIYINSKLATGDEIELDADRHHHLAQVLRLKKNEPLTVFNGQTFNGKNGEFQARLSHIERRSSRITIEDFSDVNRESPLKIHLFQGLCKGERMDYAVQKASELGVTSITPVITTYTTVHLDDKRMQKKVEHWRKVIISACEQSGRTTVPELLPAQSLPAIVRGGAPGHCLILDPETNQSLPELAIQDDNEFSLLIGPEGGLADEEVTLAKQNNFLAARLGPRILRTETAGAVTIACLQLLCGDFS